MAKSKPHSEQNDFTKLVQSGSARSSTNLGVIDKPAGETKRLGVDVPIEDYKAFQQWCTEHDTKMGPVIREYISGLLNAN